MLTRDIVIVAVVGVLAVITLILAVGLETFLLGLALGGGCSVCLAAIAWILTKENAQRSTSLSQGEQRER
jgi:hypothetical protein